MTNEKRRKYSYDERKNINNEELKYNEKEEKEMIKSLLKDLFDSDNVKICIDKKFNKPSIVISNNDEKDIENDETTLEKSPRCFKFSF